MCSRCRVDHLLPTAFPLRDAALEGNPEDVCLKCIAKEHKGLNIPEYFSMQQST